MGGMDNALPKQNCLLGLNVLRVGLFSIVCNLACGAALCPAGLPHFLTDNLVFLYSISVSPSGPSTNTSFSLKFTSVIFLISPTRI